MVHELEPKLIGSSVFSLQGLHTEAVRRSFCQVNIALLIFEDGVKSIVFLLKERRVLLNPSLMNI